MIYKNEYMETLSGWEQIYSEFLERAESCYLRWINCDDELTEAEIKLAVDYQQMIEDADEGIDGDYMEIEIPPEHEISPEELQALLRIAQKLQRQGLGQLLSLMSGINLTNDTTALDIFSGKVSNINASESQKFTTESFVDWEKLSGRVPNFHKTDESSAEEKYSLTVETTYQDRASSKCSNIKPLESQKVTNDTRVF
jgi:hypothetical protein